MMKRILLVLISLTLLSPCFLARGEGNFASPEQKGPFKVSHYEDELTNPLGKYALTVYYPSGKADGDPNGDYPAVIFAPAGFQTKNEYTWIGEVTASHGFIVLIFSVPTRVSKESTERIEGFKSAIDYLASKNIEPGHILKGKVNAKKVAVGGHSLGGRAAYGLLSQDPRPMTGFILAATSGTPDIVQKVSAPMQIQVGDKDQFTNPEIVLNSYNNLNSKTKEYLQIAGASHLQYMDAREGKTGPEKPIITREAQHQIASKYFISWFYYYLKGDTRYSDYIFGNGVKNDLKNGILSGFRTTQR